MSSSASVASVVLNENHILLLGSLSVLLRDLSVVLGLGGVTLVARLQAVLLAELSETSMGTSLASVMSSSASVASMVLNENHILLLGSLSVLLRDLSVVLGLGGVALVALVKAVLLAELGKT